MSAVAGANAAVYSGADRHLPLLESIGRKKGASSAHPCILTLELHEVLHTLQLLGHAASNDSGAQLGTWDDTYLIYSQDRCR